MVAIPYKSRDLKAQIFRQTCTKKKNREKQDKFKFVQRPRLNKDYVPGSSNIPKINIS